MSINRRGFVIALLGLAALWGWQSLRYATSQVAVLRTTGAGHVEHYASVWYVHANRALWIRAENRDRDWLAEILDNPRIELAIDGRTRSYLANPMDVAKYQAYIDSEFRRKYGLIDFVRSLRGGRDTLPIQLQPI